jgi:inorganic phosphate transporter, PiT family
VCADVSGAIALFTATGLGIPVSTTHTITGSIVGVGAARGMNKVRWATTTSILWAWVLTIPATALVAAISWYLSNFLF